MISPRTQAMAAPPPTPDQAKALFEQGFSEMAHQVLLNKLPQISQDVVTFQVLNCDPDKGTGTGTFVLSRNGQALYIPVVLVENQIKPLDILYFKGQNHFIPLNKDWLEQVDRMSVTEMGDAVKEPKTLSRDVDIRNTVVPPVTGRYSYASENGIAAAHRVFEEALAPSKQTKIAFLDILRSVPLTKKAAVVRMFDQNPAFLKSAVATYGRTALHDALFLTHGPEKVAGRMSRQGVLYIADDKTSPAELKDVFGPEAPQAFSGVKVKGYYSKDDRKSTRKVMTVPQFAMEEVKSTGTYELFTIDGDTVPAFLLANPHDIFNDDRSRKVPPRNIRFRRNNDAPADPLEGGGTHYSMPGKSGKTDHRVHIDAVVGVTKDGKLISCAAPLGQPVSASKLSVTWKEPAAGDKGFFVAKHGTSYVGTVPLTVKSVTTDSEGVRRIVATNGYVTKTLVTDPRSSYTRLTAPSGTNIVYLSAEFQFVKGTGEFDDTSLISSPLDVERVLREDLRNNGTPFYKVKKAEHQGWVFTTDRTRDYGFVDALRKIAIEMNVTVPEAEFVLKQAELTGTCEFWTVDPVHALKIAGAKEDAAAQEQQAQMDAQMQQMQQPPPPSPVDMAVAEQMQNLMQQQQALMQQQTMLQQVQMRAKQIEGGDPNAGAVAGAAFYGGPQAMGAAPVGGAPGMPGAPSQQQIDPQTGQPMQMDPSMGGQPQIDPQTGQPMQMDPSMGGQPQIDPQTGQPMDPSPQQIDPQTGQPIDQGPSAYSVDDNINVNPQFTAAASDLEGQEYFDSAAVSTLAQSQTLRDLVAGYIPNLEKTLDNMGRILLALWMNELVVKAEVGHATYTKLENNLRLVFKGLGDAVMKLNETNQVLPETMEAGADA